MALQGNNASVFAEDKIKITIAFGSEIRTLITSGTYYESWGSLIHYLDGRKYLHQNDITYFMSDGWKILTVERIF